MAITGGYVGGVAIEASLNGRIFPCSSDASVSIDVMSTANEMLVSGNGTNILKISPKTQKIEGLTVSISDSKNDLEYLQDLQATGTFFAISVLLRNGKRWSSGSMVMTGDIMLNTTETTAEITLEGTGLTSS